MEKRPVVAEDLLQIANLGDVAIDPSGRFIAFTVVRPVSQKDDYEARIHVYDLKEGTSRPWTAELQHSTSPAWSPDGRRLAFLTRRQGRPSQLAVLHRDGGEAEVLTDYEHGVGEFCFSPDGQWIALTAVSAEPYSEPSGKTESVRVAEPVRVIETLRYKFNARGFTYNRKRRVYVIPSAGGPARALTDGEFDDSSLAWSRDSRRIAFVSARHEEREFDLGSDVFTVALDTGNVNQVTKTRGGADSPVFSPDGRWIAYAGTDRLKSMPSHRAVWIVPAEGGEQRAAGREFDRTISGAGGLSWSPGGDRVYALFEDEGRAPLLSVDVETGEVRGDRAEPWQIHAFDISRDGSFAAFAASSPTRPAELFICPFDDGGRPVRLTALHDEWVSGVALSEMEPYTAKSEDGTSVPCWIMRPAGFSPERRYPAVLKIHGGPYAQFGYSFNHELQLYASSGYAVCFSNPRGSSGYSEEWARSLGRHRGILDYQDVMACVDTALERFPFIDRGRLAVTGGSYGGYMTSWIVGHTNRFRAACSEAAPNNLYSMSGSSDLAGSNHRLVYGFTAQEDPEFYMERSPISYARFVETPLLIIHSENDLRVSIEQGEQLFVALRLQRKPVKFARFPLENHNLPRSGKPSHRLQRLALIFDWFSEHLGSVSADERVEAHVDIR